jgi:hypothetical protein
MNEMENEKSMTKAGRVLLDDEFLDAVCGGQSIYDQADGLDRDSWFVKLVKKMMHEREGDPNLPLGAQESSMPRGAYAAGYRNMP